MNKGLGRFAVLAHAAHELANKYKDPQCDKERDQIPLRFWPNMIGGGRNEPQKRRHPDKAENEAQPTGDARHLTCEYADDFAGYPAYWLATPPFSQIEGL